LKKKEISGTRVTTTNKKVNENNNYFISPMDGVIGQINVNLNENCFRREEVLTIHELKDMKIKVYFDPVEMKYLESGDEVNITFPDGSESKGKIQNFHVATYALPDEFQKKYEPTTRNIVANVQLVNDLEKYKLMNFYKMNVRITKSRFKLFS
jgi:multidrug resistance efflux pump